MARDDDGATGTTVLKGALMVLGALAAVGLVLVVAKPLLLIGVLFGAGYLGYRMFGKQKALEGGRERKALSSADFDRRMRELDAIDRQLDSEIRKR
jgi:hypothetical protein